MLGPGFVQPAGEGFEQFCGYMNYQDGKKSAVKPDRQPWAEKIIAHDDDQDQHAGYQEAVVHILWVHCLPGGSPFVCIFPGVSGDAQIENGYAI